MYGVTGIRGVLFLGVSRIILWKMINQFILWKMINQFNSS